MGKGGDAKIGRKVSASASSREVQKYTWAEVKEHITPEDAWVVYQNKVYDVSNWHDHPGGAVVFTHAGDDMTDIFAAFHAQGSQAMMKKFYIGDLIPESVTHKDQRQLDFEKGYRDLRAKLVMMGMFKSSKLFYAYKCSFNMAMWATAVAMVYFSDSFAMARRTGRRSAATPDAPMSASTTSVGVRPLRCQASPPARTSRSGVLIWDAVWRPPD